MKRDTRSYRRRLQPFVAAGLLPAVPTRWQILQGELAMAPYVVSTDVTDEWRYRRAPLGHPVLRQPLIFREIGFDHFILGTGMSASAMAVCRHLQFTFHRGMPVWDLQVLQTNAGGLELLEQTTSALLEARTADDRRVRRRLERILPDPETYLRRFVGSDGYVARAAAFDYPEPSRNNPAVPPEYASLVTFMRHAETYPQHPRDLPLPRWPGHIARLATRRWREHGGLGWFRRPEVAA